MIRRCVSLIVLFCFGLFSLETVIADVHDGDASPSELANATAGATAGLVPTPAQTDGPVKAPNPHSGHVCHCAHAHGGLSASAPGLSAPPLRHDVAPVLRVIRPAKVDLDVHLRPPIA